MSKPAWMKAEEYWRDFFTDAEGQRQPGSGNQPGRPGDNRYKRRAIFRYDNNVLLESKYTESNSLSINLKWLDKITHEAALLGRVPALGLTIGNQHWLAVPTWTVTEKGEQYGLDDSTTGRPTFAKQDSQPD